MLTTIENVKSLETSVQQLRELPTLRNDLLVRRARNYTETTRNYEAFWMFRDLMTENPTDDQIEFFTYATFSSALQLNKHDAVIEIGKSYRSRFPDGQYYPEVTLALVNTLRNVGDNEYVQISQTFIDSHPKDAVAAELLNIWAVYKVENAQFESIDKQISVWLKSLDEPIFKDGLYYWLALSKLLTGDYKDAIVHFQKVLEYPESRYAEDSLLRLGVSYFYSNHFDSSKETFYKYVDIYPQGYASDQAYYFLGELEKLTGKAGDLIIGHPWLLHHLLHKMWVSFINQQEKKCTT